MADGSPLGGRRPDADTGANTTVVLERADDGKVWLTLSTIDTTTGDVVVVSAYQGPAGRLWLAAQLVRTIADEARAAVADRLQRVRRG